MIRHIVLFKLKEGVAGEDERVARAFEVLRSLPGKIEGIESWEVGENFSERPIATDYALFSSFRDREGLSRYMDHSAHREVVALLAEVCTWQVCDYVS